MGMPGRPAPEPKFEQCLHLRGDLPGSKDAFGKVAADDGFWLTHRGEVQTGIPPEQQGEVRVKAGGRGRIELGEA